MLPFYAPFCFHDCISFFLSCVPVLAFFWLEDPFLSTSVICFSSQLFVGRPATFDAVNNVLYFCVLFITANFLLHLRDVTVFITLTRKWKQTNFNVALSG